MAPRSVWSGSIAFGLVHVPVHLYTTLETSSDLSFNQVHKACSNRITVKRWCGTCDIEVPFEDLVKGFPLGEQMVVVDPSELEAVRPQASRTIVIEGFVPAAGVDPVYFDTSYSIGAGATAEGPLVLLRQAMVARNVAAVARIVLRLREHLCLLRPTGEGMMLHTLHWADQVRKPVPMPDTAAPSPMLAQAVALVEAYTLDEVDLSEYRDRYRDDVMAMIEAKAEGLPIPVEVATAPPVGDLLTALEASLAAAKQRRAS